MTPHPVHVVEFQSPFEVSDVLRNDFSTGSFESEFQSPFEVSDVLSQFLR